MCQAKDRKLVGFYTSFKDAADQPARLMDDSLECDLVLLSVTTTFDDLSGAPKS